jgi:hypothetical protein
MAANQADAYTSNMPNRSRNGASSGFARKYWATRSMLTARCGSTEPGIAATASRNSSTSAVRMLVSWRQELRRKAHTGLGRRGGGEAAGASRSVTTVTAASPRRS